MLVNHHAEHELVSSYAHLCVFYPTKFFPHSQYICHDLQQYHVSMSQAGLVQQHNVSAEIG